MVASDIEIGWRTQLTTETRPWAIELAAEMDVGDSISSVTATLVDLIDGSSFPTGLSGSASAAGTVVTQSVTGLVANHNYRLVLTAAMGGAKTTATVLYLKCPY
jgi:hypothetical protein